MEPRDIVHIQGCTLIAMLHYENWKPFETTDIYNHELLDHCCTLLTELSLRQIPAICVTEDEGEHRFKKFKTFYRTFRYVNLCITIFIKNSNTKNHLINGPIVYEEATSFKPTRTDEKNWNSVDFDNFAFGPCLANRKSHLCHMVLNCLLKVQIHLLH